MHRDLDSSQPWQIAIMIFHGPKGRYILAMTMHADVDCIVSRGNALAFMCTCARAGTGCASPFEHDLSHKGHPPMLEFAKGLIWKPAREVLVSVRRMRVVKYRTFILQGVDSYRAHQLAVLNRA